MVKKKQTQKLNKDTSGKKWWQLQELAKSQQLFGEMAVWSGNMAATDRLPNHLIL